MENNDSNSAQDILLNSILQELKKLNEQLVILNSRSDLEHKVIKDDLAAIMRKLVFLAGRIP